eukprot:10463682-Ditylum_brightwellii.AAC.1
MIFYLGIVKLPSIKDYWDTQQYMPGHQIAKELGMTHDRFIFLWQNFHIYNVKDLDVQAEKEAGTSDEDDKEVNLYDDSIEQIQHDQEDSNEKNKSEDDEETETKSEEDDETSQTVWYYKLKHLIDNVRDASVLLIWLLGACLALDGMMVRFSGRSMKTHYIKDKPIGEGCNLFTLSTTAGYIVNFTPDDRTAAKSQQQEYKTMNSVEKIENMILNVISIISHLCDK